MARPGGIEPPYRCLEGTCVIHYATVGIWCCYHYAAITTTCLAGLEGLEPYKVVLWARLESNQHSRHYEYHALPLSYRPTKQPCLICFICWDLSPDLWRAFLPPL